MSAIATEPTVSQLRVIAAHFQRSINVIYDEGDEAYIGGYIPTEAGANALASVLETSNDRSHVFYAPYGSGKSLVSLVLGALVQKRSEESLNIVCDRLKRHFPDQGEIVAQHLQSDSRLLPVFLLGDEGTLREALIRALTRAVGRIGDGSLRPRTQYTAAVNTIKRWEGHYTTVYSQLSIELEKHDIATETFVEKLNASSLEALTLFEKLYVQLTAGARFDEFAGVSLADIFAETVQRLKEVGYDGVMVIWDEFGRFMEAKSNQVFGTEATQLQDFAEACDRSGNNQIHLVLVTHRQLATYAGNLPEAYQQEWARIAERFQTHDITSDPAITYRIIGEALETVDEEQWENFCEAYKDGFAQLEQRTAAYSLFKESADLNVVTQLWPLHPLTAYALPRLTRVAAQNERTLFTFLAADEANTLQAHLETLAGWSLVNIDTLWDYFADAIRADRSIGGTNRLWSGVIHALSKTASDENLAQRLIKALGILSIVDDVNVQTNAISGRIVPSTEMLAWAVQASESDTRLALEALARKRVIVSSRADGFWRFLRGSDVDLEAAVADLKAQQSPTRLQLRQRLQTEIAPPVYWPRGYNLERRMTRFFTTLYRWHDELKGIGSDEFLKQLHPSYGYADGVVVFILTLSSAEREQVIETIKNLPPSRAVFVVPDHALLLNDPLAELFALYDLQHNPQFMSQDERLHNEVAFFVEDAQRRIRQLLTPFFQPHRKQTQWFHHAGGAWQAKAITSARQISQLLTRFCEHWFPNTPSFNVEPLNLHKPSKVQSNAAERLNDLLLRRVPDDIYPRNFGIKGSKPESLIMRTMLVQTGLVETGQGGWRLREPADENLITVWGLINNFLESARGEEAEITPLIERLQLPPYGLRRGVLPIVLAAAFRPHMKVLTLRRNRRVVTPIDGETFTQLVSNADDFTVELGLWDDRRAALWAVLEQHVFSFLAPAEQEHHPLSYLSLGLLRWLTSQAKYCRDTNNLSADAIQLRKLIYQAHNDPASVLFHDLLDLLGDDEEYSETYQSHLAQRLSNLTSEISSSYRVLLYELDRFAEETFADDATSRKQDGYAAIRYWLVQLEQEASESVDNMRFSDRKVQGFVKVVNNEMSIGKFWEQLGRALVGSVPSDWNDASVERFRSELLRMKEELRREMLDLQEDDETIELTVNRPNEGEQNYKFRSSQLSQQGKNILANFKTTMAISGRPLSPDEKRQVALAFLHFMLEGEDSSRERKNKSHRVH